ncbi:hypothetical protein PsorP6_002781 [Peronosclerospora sorghi]|uniref:Uncharacterized protein n=1 Tax=Peronosclerospora sorghi TaxID=230839 RepID=A0ACC0VIR5_9STRA|nr:hypothetical protein PsorP6_002781 [Peronosclerospora sorghi]
MVGVIVRGENILCLAATAYSSGSSIVTVVCLLCSCIFYGTNGIRDVFSAQMTYSYGQTAACSFYSCAHPSGVLQAVTGAGCHLFGTLPLKLLNQYTVIIY